MCPGVGGRLCGAGMATPLVAVNSDRRLLKQLGSVHTRLPSSCAWALSILGDELWWLSVCWGELGLTLAGAASPVGSPWDGFLQHLTVVPLPLTVSLRGEGNSCVFMSTLVGSSLCWKGSIISSSLHVWGGHGSCG